MVDRCRCPSVHEKWESASARRGRWRLTIDLKVVLPSF